MTDVNFEEAMSRLTVLCPPPPHSGLAGESGFESDVASVPASHRKLVATYGTGCFDEFLWIFAEGAPNGQLDIAERTRLLRANFRDKGLHELNQVLREYRAAPHDLVQWGGTDNADILAWITKGEPEGWPTVIIQAGQLRAVVCSASSTATILALLDGSLRVPFFPSDFPDLRPEFSTNPYA
ncbi:hypothetical protein ABTX71_31280 [Streptomyces parvulus]|uniref:hypothetical protein n=1 Tax=Streptomyces parvulus TaxID=146923 RepID=UPI003333A11A